MEFNLVGVDGDHWFLYRKLLLETLAAMATKWRVRGRIEGCSGNCGILFVQHHRLAEDAFAASAVAKVCVVWKVQAFEWSRERSEAMTMKNIGSRSLQNTRTCNLQR